jgi:hypothetical protein
MTLNEVIADTVEKIKDWNSVPLQCYRKLFLDARFYNTLCVTGMFSVFDSAYQSTFGFANVPSLVAMTFIKTVQSNSKSSATLVYPFWDIFHILNSFLYLPLII